MPIDPTETIDESSADSVLRLEYACTPKERSEAESLSLRHQIGGGSKWLTLAIMLVVLAAMLWFMGRFMLRTLPGPVRPYAVGGFFVLWAVLFFRERHRKRPAPGAPVKLELSAAGIRAGDSDTQIVTPWSAYARVVESENVFLLKPRSIGVSWVIPKRVIPSDAWTQWIRNIPAHPTEVPAPPAAATSEPREAIPPMPDDEMTQVTVRGGVGFLDLVDMNAASWSGRGLMIGWAAMVVGVSIYSAFQPHPYAKFTELQMIFIFIIPLSSIGAFIQLLFISAHSWPTHRLPAGRRTIHLGDRHLTVSSPDGTATVPLTTYKRYKETRRLFILWIGFRGNWLMLPKHGFESIDDVKTCRELLARNLQTSTWFFGH